MMSTYRMRATLPASNGTDPRRLVAANDAAVAWFRAQLTSAEPPRRYLTSRGLGTLVDREWPWRVGFAPPGWTALTDHLTAAGFTADELVTAGLSKPTRRDPSRLIDVFRDRVVFPIRDRAGDVVGFIGRASPAASAADPSLPKYLNTHESPIYRKDELLFGVAEQRERISAGWRPVLVEGPADTIATWLSYSRFGTSGSVAVAPCGTALGAAQAATVREMPGAREGLVVAFDGDDAGRKAADAAFELLHQTTPPGRLFAAEFTAGADPAALLERPNGRAQLRAALRHQTRPLLWAVVDHQLDRILANHPQILDHFEGRYTVANVLAPRVLLASDGADAGRLTRHIARRTGSTDAAVAGYAAEWLLRSVELLESDTRRPLGTPTGAVRPPPAAAAFGRLTTTAADPAGGRQRLAAGLRPGQRPVETTTRVRR
ncbi:toprim domain-containing protein [Micromonospora arborensis]|uniref:toprim domain-containing protein n=1 Tax=Micromonospora arborensis TaxID=2116518 RepID=UPI0033C606ED